MLASVMYDDAARQWKICDCVMPSVSFVDVFWLRDRFKQSLSCTPSRQVWSMGGYTCWVDDTMGCMGNG